MNDYLVLPRVETVLNTVSDDVSFCSVKRDHFLESFSLLFSFLLVFAAVVAEFL